MSNGRQLDGAIQEATEHLAREGWESADLRLVMLATTGYLANEIRRPPWTRFRIVATAGATFGTTLGAVIVTVVRFL
jgi:hypothetical protein